MDTSGSTAAGGEHGTYSMAIVLWKSLLLGLGQSIDNFAAGTGYAASNRPLAWQHNAFIALVNAGGTLLTMETGNEVLRLLPGEGRDSSARALGGYILILLGVKELFCGGGDREVVGPARIGGAGRVQHP